jgi:hypothetical protein
MQKKGQTMAKSDLRKEIKQEIKERMLAERSFLRFCKFVDAKHPIEAHHVQVLAEKLEQVAKYILSGGAEGISRLMVFMPPRYWKSQTASRKFPAWLLGKNPDLRIILTSYNADLASKHSKAVRDLITSEEYSQVFGALASADEPVMLDPESKASASWDIAEHRGGMIAAGVGGGITGFGANLFIIDDPVKGRKEASSESQREDSYEWYRSTAYTRVENGGAIIVIMTRWDVEDLAGQLLKAMVSDPEADQWEVVMMPATALEAEQYPTNEEAFVENLLRGVYVPMHGDQLGRAPGEPLWVKKHTEAMLKGLAANMDDFEFSAQFQQMPRLAKGNFFDEDDFKIIDKAPDGLRWFRYSDLALGKTSTSDFNACYAVAMNDKGDLFIRDPLKERNLDEYLNFVRAAMLTDEESGVRWGFEDVAFQHLVFKEMLKDKRLARIALEAVMPVGSKTDRASSWRGRAKAGKVYLIRGTWNLGFLRIASAFKENAREDDDIDSVSGGVQMIAEDASGDGKTATSAAVVVSAEELFSGQQSAFSFMER